MSALSLRNVIRYSLRLVNMRSVDNRSDSVRMWHDPRTWFLSSLADQIIDHHPNEGVGSRQL